MKTYSLAINGKQYDVTIKDYTNGQATVAVNGVDLKVEVLNQESVQQGAAPVVAAAPAPKAAAAPKVAPAPAAGGAGKSAVKAPLPGTVTEIAVKVGDAVKRGQVIGKMEAMKMVNDILADKDGKIAAVKVNVGDTVMQGDALIEIEAGEVAAAPAAAPAPAPAAAPAPKPAAKAAPSGPVVKAPLPGTITEISVKVGDAVKRGQVIGKMEAMKMVNDILAEKDGSIAAIHVNVGDTVMQGDVVIEMA